jgi:hypothetical protein
VVVASQDDDKLVEESRFGDTVDQFVHGFLAIWAFAETVCFVHEEHFAQRALDELLSLRAGLSDVLTNEILRGAFDDFGCGEEAHVVVDLAHLSSCCRFAGACRRKLVEIHEAGESKLTRRTTKQKRER